MIRVAVAGAAGRLGSAVCTAVEQAEDLSLAGRADPVLGTSVCDAAAAADVLVDFTRPDVAVDNVRTAVGAGVHAVVGTTGFELDEVRALLEGEGPNVFVAPNFAIGAVLMMRFATEAARHMQAAEIVELHHPAKLDAPSGTARRTAEMIKAASGELPPIHSVRLPGIVADQEVILGDAAQTLTISHRTTDRTSFVPGVLLAIRGVAELPERLTVGLDSLLWPRPS